MPSPQSMVAVKSLKRRRRVGIGECATGPLKSGGAKTGTGKIGASVGEIVGWGRAVNAASAMMAEPEKVVAAPHHRSP